jgi:2-oxo-3-hexenedioate decarboxylase
MSRFGLGGRMLTAWDTASKVTPPTAGEPGFDLDEAYAVAEEIRARRVARGERLLGYKIGFTNRGIWDKYGVHAPIWGPVWDSTVSQVEGASVTVSLAGLVQPRIEPEIMFGFARTPAPGMDPVDLASCIEWVAHGFEIVHTHFAGWQFEAPDTVADFALHGRLLVGARAPIARFSDPRSELAALTISLLKNGQEVDRGTGAAVLDGPLDALRIWVEAMAAQPQRWPIEPGAIVTTGTLTDAWPMAPGERWETHLGDAHLPGLTLHTTA